MATDTGDIVWFRVELPESGEKAEVTFGQFMFQILLWIVSPFHGVVHNRIPDAEVGSKVIGLGPQSISGLSQWDHSEVLTFSADEILGYRINPKHLQLTTVKRQEFRLRIQGLSRRQMQRIDESLKAMISAQSGEGPADGSQ